MNNKTISIIYPVWLNVNEEWGYALHDEIAYTPRNLYYANQWVKRLNRRYNEGWRVIVN